MLRGTHGFEQTVLLKGKASEKENRDDRHDDRDRRDENRREDDRGDNRRDQDDRDRRQDQPQYRIEVVPVSTVKSGECEGLNKVTFTGKITGEDSTVEQAANGDIILGIRVKKVGGGSYMRSGRFFIKFNSFCDLPTNAKGIPYDAGIYEITTSIRLSSSEIGKVIYLQTNADKRPDGSEGERNYCAIRVVRN